MKKAIRLALAALLLTSAMYASAPAFDGPTGPMCPVPPCTPDGGII